ncbi:hypothetical protein [Coxiella endosymbiont of Ornithodoros maritimus]|uniref:hypothetical protein n=1 Tax=Coxiella endosymbiont of Ornithodoros maritimus TaxID=1656172 RepID=UPI002263B3E8|nr:hypothetical protein [Coxiella endosymbiont of Ornithodoros maritimus]
MKLSDVVYQTLFVLTEEYPINKESFVTGNAIESNHILITSTDFQSDAEELVTWFRMQELSDCPHPLNPFTNERFSERNKKYIKNNNDLSLHYSNYRNSFDNQFQTSSNILRLFFSPSLRLL